MTKLWTENQNPKSHLMHPLSYLFIFYKIRNLTSMFVVLYCKALEFVMMSYHNNWIHQNGYQNRICLVNVYIINNILIIGLSEIEVC